MQCELQYHLTPLPDLCRLAARQSNGKVADLFGKLGRELEDQITPDVSLCMNAALNRTSNLPNCCREALECLGKTMGRFDLDGQIRGFDAVRGLCRQNLDTLSAGREVRLRSYQTLGLCAGAALVILFV
jgi:stage III sporulation protein AB